MSEENQQVNEKKESCASSAIPTELENFKKICSSRCTICSSGILKAIHDWKKDGMNLDRMVELAREEKSVDISVSSLSRHFKAYRAFKLEMATQIIKNDVIEEVTLQSVHIKKTVELLDLAYDQLLTKFKSGIYKIEVADLEKLAKMRYSILNGEATDDKDLVAIFQKASDEYGLNLQQGVLFKA